VSESSAQWQQRLRFGTQSTYIQSDPSFHLGTVRRDNFQQLTVSTLHTKRIPIQTRGGRRRIYFLRSLILNDDQRLPAWRFRELYAHGNALLSRQESGAPRRRYYGIRANIPMGRFPPFNEATRLTWCVTQSQSRVRKSLWSPRGASRRRIPPWRETPRIAPLIIRAKGPRAVLDALILRAEESVHNARGGGNGGKGITVMYATIRGSACRVAFKLGLFMRASAEDSKVASSSQQCLDRDRCPPRGSSAISRR